MGLKGATRRGCTAGKTRPYGETIWALILYMADDDRVQSYIEQYGGIVIGQLRRGAGWTERRTRGAIQNGMKAKDPVFEKSVWLKLPLKQSAFGFRLNRFGKMTANLLMRRDYNYAVIDGELRLLYPTNLEDLEEGELNG